MKKWQKQQLFYKYSQIFIFQQKKPIEERIKWGIEQREKGNDYFKNHNFKKAHEYYIFSLACMGADLPSSPDVISAFNNQVRIPSMNNAAACEIQMEHYEQAVFCCDAVLDIDENNTKALLRKAKALIKWEKMKDGLNILDKLSTLVKQVFNNIIIIINRMIK